MGSGRRRSGPPDPLQALYGRSRRSHPRTREEPEPLGPATGRQPDASAAQGLAPRAARRERRRARKELAAAAETGAAMGTEAERARGGWLPSLLRWVTWLMFMALALVGAARAGYEYAPLILERLDRWVNSRL